jgi:hypothetical protein
MVHHNIKRDLLQYQKRPTTVSTWNSWSIIISSKAPTIMSKASSSSFSPAIKAPTSTHQSPKPPQSCQKHHPLHKHPPPQNHHLLHEHPPPQKHRPPTIMSKASSSSFLPAYGAVPNKALSLTHSLSLVSVISCDFASIFCGRTRAHANF